MDFPKIHRWVYANLQRIKLNRKISRWLLQRKKLNSLKTPTDVMDQYKHGSI